ncbi:MAG TPA: deoxyhypusine synthase [archaeon]|nr:deoxyhypusine synthase [archaeon]
MKPTAPRVEDFKLTKDMTIPQLLEQMRRSGGFTAKQLGVAGDILKALVADQQALRFLSFPACINATGTRGVLVEALKRKWFDVVVTTCGTLDHDLARLFNDYYHGRFDMDDKALHDQQVQRLGNILIPSESYGGTLEDHLQGMFADILEKASGKSVELGTHELIWEIGRRLEDHPRKEESLIYWSWKHQIPMFIPGPYDGATGNQLWVFQQDHPLKLVLARDETKMSDLVFGSEKTGALMVGGGISKHYTLWWSQFKGGLNYAVYLTTASEYDGSLSGARIKEAVSWGKINAAANFVTVQGDATITLPMLLATLL